MAEATIAAPSPAAQEQDPIAVTPTEVKTHTLLATLEPDFTVKLEGKTVDNVRVTRNLEGVVLVDAAPIFDALDGDYEITAEGVLTLTRSQDGAVMSLDTATGIVSANGKALGKLGVFGEVSDQGLFLTANAIAVLSGAIGKEGDEDNTIEFELDPRLKVATGFELFVNDIPLGNVEPAPRAVGSVLLLPLLPISQELGHEVTVVEGGSKVVVKRAQDSAVFSLNLNTGLVELNNRPYGVSKDATYIDQTNLLVPISAFETLTGTHVTIEGGSGRISVTLDNRLAGAIKPSERVSDATKAHPFTLETLDFHVGTDTANTVTAQMSYKNLNTRVRYEVPDLPQSSAELEPAWLSVDYLTTGGAQGSIGDYSADFRELDGVGVRRIRGASYVKTGEKGRWAVAAGAPVSGSRQISEDQNRLDFGGFAAGARYADVKGWEAGLSYRKDAISDDQVAVLSAISGKLGRKKGLVKEDEKIAWDARADLGYFNGPAREKSVDMRLSGAARVDVSKMVSVDSFASYTGAEFLRSDLDREDRVVAIDPETQLPVTDDEEQLVPDVRKRGQDMVQLGLTTQIVPRRDIGPLSNPAVSMRVQTTRTGVTMGTETAIDQVTYGAAFNTSIAKTGINVGVDYSAYSVTEAQIDAPAIKDTGNQITVRAYKDFKHATVRTTYSSTRKNDEDAVTRLDGMISAKPVRIALPKEASVSIAPSLTGSLINGEANARAGIVANATSGELFGPKTVAEASFGILQPVTGTGDQKTDSFLTVSVGRRLRINDNLQMGMSYRNDLKGNQRLGIFLDGKFGFNAARKFQKTQDGRGVLKGRVFFDKNRNGVMDDDENGIGGAQVRVEGTRLALGTDQHGFFTIQNIKVGLHEVTVDGRSLPLGFAVSEDIMRKASVHDGHITDVQVAIVQRGQIRGFAFADENADGAYQKSENRLEGARIKLTSQDDTDRIEQMTSASFGQFAFDDLEAGRYWLEITNPNAKNAEPSERIEVVLENDEGGDLMRKVQVGAPVRREIQLAKETEIETSAQADLETAPEKVQDVSP